MDHGSWSFPVCRRVITAIGATSTKSKRIEPREVDYAISSISTGAAWPIGRLGGGCLLRRYRLATTTPLANTADNKPATNINAGTLTCKSKGGVGLIIGSKTRLNGAYKPAGKGAVRHYTATVTKIGLDIGIKRPTTVIWGILASRSICPKGRCRGTMQASPLVRRSDLVRARMLF